MTNKRIAHLLIPGTLANMKRNKETERGCQFAMMNASIAFTTLIEEADEKEIKQCSSRYRSVQFF
jgi:hypothetical protein